MYTSARSKAPNLGTSLLQNVRGSCLAQACMCMQALAAEKKASRRQVLEAIQGKAVDTCLAVPFAEAAAAGASSACVALAHGWHTYVCALDAQV